MGEHVPVLSDKSTPLQSLRPPSLVHAVTLDGALQLGKVNNSLGTCIPPRSFPLVAIKEYKSLVHGCPKSEVILAHSAVPDGECQDVLMVRDGEALDNLT